MSTITVNSCNSRQARRGIPAVVLRSSIEILLAGLLLFLPFHTVFFKIIQVESNIPPGLQFLLTSWKEVVLGILLGLALLWQIGLNSHILTVPKILVLVVVFMLAGVFSLLKSPSLLMGVYAFRGTFQPFFLLVIVMLVPVSVPWLHKTLKWILIIGFIVSVFAIFQSLVLGYSFLWKYYAVNDRLATSFSFAGGGFQRAMGTFSSPNQLSLYLVFLILFAINYWLRTRSRKTRVYLALFLLVSSFALLLSVSRSGWIALMSGLAFSFLVWRRKQRLVPVLVFAGVIATIVAVVFGLEQHLINTLAGKEPSANYRIQITISNLQTMWNEPLGVGLGWVGARAARFGEDFDRLATESYLLQIGMELGIQGLSLFLAISALSIIQLYRSIFGTRTSFGRVWTVSATACLLAALTHALFIPDLQDLTVGIYLWFIVGIGVRFPLLENRNELRSRKPPRESGLAVNSS